MKTRIFMILGVIAAMTALALGTSGIAHASVGYGNQYDRNAAGLYFNAWNGGPDINVYNGQAANNDFLTQAFDLNGVELTLSNNGTDNGYCIGDAGNNSGSARAGLSACSAGSVPWGGYFIAYTCSNGDGLTGYQFKDKHWNAWLGPSNTGNGAAFYLNQASASCYSQENPY